MLKSPRAINHRKSKIQLATASNGLSSLLAGALVSWGMRHTAKLSTSIHTMQINADYLWVGEWFAGKALLDEYYV